MLAIIPARGGSKSLLKKNIKPLLGKPLLAYTIESAQAARSIDRIVLSTDDAEIAEAAAPFGVEIPFMRPPELATDTARAIDAYLFTVEKLHEEFDIFYSNFVVLQPTSPLRSADDIDGAVALFHEKKAESVISVCRTTHPPHWARRIDADGVLRDYFHERVGNENRQELDEAYRPNGAVFVFQYALLKAKSNYYSDKTYPYVMPRERSVDIDDMLDFEMVEFLMMKANAGA